MSLALDHEDIHRMSTSINQKILRAITNTRTKLIEHSRSNQEVSHHNSAFDRWT